MTNKQALKIALDCMRKAARDYAFGAGVADRLGDAASAADRRAQQQYAEIVQAMQKLEEVMSHEQKRMF